MTSKEGANTQHSSLHNLSKTPVDLADVHTTGCTEWLCCTVCRLRINELSLPADHAANKHAQAVQCSLPASIPAGCNQYKKHMHGKRVPVHFGQQ